MPGTRFITLPAPPPEFDLEVWQLSLARLLEGNLDRIYLTHFGCVEDVGEHFESLVSRLNQASDFVRKRMLERVGRRDIIKEFIGWNRERALELGVGDEQFAQLQTANPADISVDGIMRYWRRKWERENR